MQTITRVFARITLLTATVAAAVVIIPARQVPAAPPTSPDWNTILSTPAQGQPPAPLDKIIWRPDLAAALAEARAANRPLFVTLRCLPCKQCSAFDKDVLEGGPDLDPLLRQFITVRLTSAKDVDLRLLPMQDFQDLDLSWWGYFLSPEGRVYGIFGGRDEVSDETRISVPALINTLKRVLAHHYDPRRASWDIDGPAPAITHAPLPPTQLPGWASWSKDRKFDKKTAEAACLHCHQIAEILRQPALDAHTFDKAHDLDMWPLPENVGLKLDRDDGLRVTAVTPDSPAAKAGLKPGDQLAAAADRRLFGQTDFRGVLHRAPNAAGEIPIHWLRDNKPMNATLAFPDGWRKTVLDWRMSISQGNIGAEPGFWPLPASPAIRKKFAISEDKLCIHPYATNGNAKAAGLTDKMYVTAIDNQSPNLAQRGLLVWFRLHHELGDPVTLTVIDPEGQQKQIQYKAGRWE
jgi:serine protease Do